MKRDFKTLIDRARRAGCEPISHGQAVYATCPVCGEPGKLVLTNGPPEPVECTAGCDPLNVRAALGRLTFPTSALPTPMRALVEEGADAIGIDPAMIAPHCLAVAASAIGVSRSVRLKPGFIQHPVIWVATIVESGCTKTAGMDLATAPLDKLQREAFAEYKAKAEDHETTPPQLIVDFVTRESIGPLLRDNHRGLLACSDELAGWVNRMNEYKTGGSDKEFWLQVFEAKRLLSNTKSDGATYVPNPRISLCGTIQPAVAAKVFSSMNVRNGLAGRLLLCAPESRFTRWSTETVSDDTTLAWEKTVKRLHCLCPRTDEHGEDEPILVELDDDARKRFAAFYDEMAERGEQSPEAVAPALSKMRGHCARVALVLHLTDEAGRGFTFEEPTKINAETMQCAIEICRWFADEAERIYADLASETGADASPDRLFEWLCEKGSADFRTIHKEGMRCYRKNTEQAKADLEALIHAGRVIRVPQAPRGGRQPADRFIPAEGAGPTWTHPGPTGNGPYAA